MVKEMGLEAKQGEPELAAQVFETLGEAWYRMADKVGKCRWFGVVSALENFMDKWSRRYVVLLFLCLELGMFKSTPISVLAPRNDQASGVVEEQGGGGGVRRRGGSRHHHSSFAKELHEHIGALHSLLGGPDVHTMLGVVVLLLSALGKEFQWAHCTMRSVDGAFEVYRALTCEGRGRVALAETADFLSSTHLFEIAELLTPGRWPKEEVLAQILRDPHHPTLLQESSVVAGHVDLVVQLLKARLRSLSWSDRGYPGRFVALLAGLEEQRWGLASMAKYWALFHRVKQIPGAEWKRVRNRSCSRQKVVQKVPPWVGSLAVDHCAPDFIHDVRPLSLRAGVSWKCVTSYVGVTSCGGVFFSDCAPWRCRCF